MDQQTVTMTEHAVMICEKLIALSAEFSGFIPQCLDVCPEERDKAGYPASLGTFYSQAESKGTNRETENVSSSTNAMRMYSPRQNRTSHINPFPSPIHPCSSSWRPRICGPALFCQ